MKQRIEYLDVVKGVGMLLVIVCHSIAFPTIFHGINSDCLNWLHENRFIYSNFFIVLFFVASGFFIKPEQPFLHYVYVGGGV